MESAHTPLWGQLANRWFRESIATDSLRVLLRDPDLRTSFLGMVEERTGVRLAGISGFHREISTKGGRIDFLGVDHQERPLLVVESKLGHWMSTRQMANYLAHQRDGLSQSTSQLSGVLMLLVPSGRLAEALGVMQAVAMGEGDLSGTGPRIEFTAGMGRSFGQAGQRPAGRLRGLLSSRCGTTEGRLRGVHGVDQAR